MDEQFNNQAQEAGDQLNQAAEQSWQNLEAAANQAAEQTQAAAEQAYQGWQAQQVPHAAPQMPQYGQDDPNRWTGELYTPETTPPAQPYHQAPGNSFIDAQPIDIASTPPTPKEKDKFPVWAIVLIVLLVLCICVACTIVPFVFLGKFLTEAVRL